GIDGRAALGKNRRERSGRVLLDLLQMPDHVAKRNQTVLDVVIDLASQITDGGASLGISHASSACAQAGCKVAQHTGERPDFIGASAETHIKAIEIEYGRLRGKVGERSADP